jgi:membrane protease YdiL (CAAX protease family)
MRHAMRLSSPLSRRLAAPLHACLLGGQVLGLLGSSHLLAALLRQSPGFATSRLAADLSAAGPEADAALASVVLREVLLPAGLEELFFRGLVFDALRRVAGIAPAIAGSAALFGLVHADAHHAAAATALGLQLGALRAAHGLPLAVLAHAANNAAALWATRAGLTSSAVSLSVAALLAGSAVVALVKASRRPLVPPAEAIPIGPLQRDPRSDD